VFYCSTLEREMTMTDQEQAAAIFNHYFEQLALRSVFDGVVVTRQTSNAQLLSFAVEKPSRMIPSYHPTDPTECERVTRSGSGKLSNRVAFF